ncbi:MAG: hypothetical protein FWH14_05390 [Oscillospiraceae bacterium]|nr:hypothetical protein [Oscillospiraceae bacterium]
MKADRLTDKEYEDLSIQYEQNPPKLSGRRGFFTELREQALIDELLPPGYARVVKTKAQVMSLSPSELIQFIIKSQITEGQGTPI